MRPWPAAPGDSPNGGAAEQPGSGGSAPGSHLWVARPPNPLRPYRIPRSRARYTGPPSYPVPPRWGFPALVWRWPTALPSLAPKVSPLEKTMRLSRQLEVVLPALAAATGLAAIGEIWRYALLVQSLSGALSGGVVLASDLLVTISSIVSIIGSVVATVLGLRWLICARSTAAAASGQRPARSDWQVLLGALVPGLNLAVPGSTLAELEHTVLGRSADIRPQPSGLVRAWWGCWALGALLLVATVLMYLPSSAQAQADSALLHATADAVACVLCVFSVRLVHYLTALLAPVDLTRTHWMRVVTISGAPPPPLRPDRPAGARR